jgi:hypothetical protein
VKKIVDKIVDFGKEIGKFIQDPLGYEWALSDSRRFDVHLGGPGTSTLDTGAAIFGAGQGLIISANGVLPGKVQCDNCHLDGYASTYGRIAFSIREGLTDGKLQVGAGLDSNIALSVKVSGQVKKPLDEVKLFSKNLANIEIPGFFSLGPMATVKLTLDLYAAAEIEFQVGASFKISPGDATLDLLHKENTGIKGLQPEFNSFAKFNDGNGVVTLALTLPIGLEFGIDLLNGKFHKTVGIFEQPSFQIVGTVGQEKSCTGLDVSLKIANDIYASALGVYDYNIDHREFDIAKLGCIG